MIIIH